MTRLSGAIYRLGFGLAALATGSSAGLSAQEGLQSERLCKPVVPQFIVTLTSSERETDGLGLWILFDEEGGPPHVAGTDGRSYRSSFCTSIDSTCVASRARYEVRHEGVRDQSVKIRSNGKEEKPRWLGGVLWNGPAYPDRVRIACNLDERDMSKACQLQGVEYSPNPATSGKDGSMPNMGRNDQCQPKPSSTFAIAP